MSALSIDEVATLLTLVRREIKSLDPYGNCHLDKSAESNAVTVARLTRAEGKLCEQYNHGNWRGSR